MEQEQQRRLGEEFFFFFVSSVLNRGPNPNLSRDIHAQGGNPSIFTETRLSAHFLGVRGLSYSQAFYKPIEGFSI